MVIYGNKPPRQASKELSKISSIKPLNLPNASLTNLAVNIPFLTHNLFIDQ